MTDKFVDIRKVAPSAGIDIRYATTDNFTGKRVYSAVNPLLRVDVAAALKRVQRSLRQRGLSLKIWDAYRPMAAQEKLWAVCSDERYVANPVKEPRHVQGIAVDLTVVDGEGRELEMPSGYDEFSLRAHRDYKKMSPVAARNCRLLEKAMEAEGFTGLPTEWWHFDFLAKQL